MKKRQLFAGFNLFVVWDLFMQQVAFARNNDIFGNVIDKKGLLHGVSVFDNGTLTGTVSGFKGYNSMSNISFRTTMVNRQF